MSVSWALKRLPYSAEILQRHKLPWCTNLSMTAAESWGDRDGHKSIAFIQKNQRKVLPVTRRQGIHGTNLLGQSKRAHDWPFPYKMSWFNGMFLLGIAA